MSREGEMKRIAAKEANINANEQLMIRIKSTLEKEGISNCELAKILGVDDKSLSPYFSKTRGYIFPATYYIKMVKYIKSRKEVSNA